MSLGSEFTKSSTAPSMTFARTVEGASGGGLNSAVSAAPRIAAMGEAMKNEEIRDCLKALLGAHPCDICYEDGCTPSAIECECHCHERIGAAHDHAELVLAALESEKPLAVVEGWLTDVMLTDLRHKPPGWFLYTVPIQKVKRGGFIHPVTVTITERKP